MTDAAPDPVVASSLAFLRNLLRDFHPRDFAVRFWDGTVWGAAVTSATVVIANSTAEQGERAAAQ